MKKKLKMKKSTKYLVLVIIDLIVIFNLPLILRDVETINDYRYNILILVIFFIVNTIADIKIEK